MGLVGLLVLILRWAFRRGSSVVAAPARPGHPDAYGLMLPVASPATHVDGEAVLRRLEENGVRANLSETLDGLRVMVWPADVARARAVLGRPR